MEFKILKKSKKSRARLGVLKTSHGEVLTPSLVPVATRATVKTLSADEAKATKSQILISNTFHLHLRPGEKILKSAGGIHKFMNWDRPLMTDSGGFQVFSLGFGRDTKVGKILKIFPGVHGEKDIKKNTQPKFLKITDDGVTFRSPIDGRELFMGPRESIKIQENIGADIIFAFDECTSPLAERAYIVESLKRTHVWAKACLKARKSKNQALFGIIQGSHFKDLREESAGFINSLPFDGFGIGGDLGSSKEMMRDILKWTIPRLNEERPRHLLGIGYLEDMEDVIKSGIDLFDCTVPTHYGRRGIAFVSGGKLNLNQSKYLKDKNPLDKKCKCMVCETYTRSYLCHLFRAEEITGMKLLTFHNLYFFNTYVEILREKIKKGIL
ncbi:MAG: hypothetical protein A3A04_02660 [Candidatus Harrisonbacteria bacterium RIFCSPLOWO2_01_FULL_40_28]|uniref:Queuine tRNA-ribosyltransferase n=1 Tax=Candidatus Harrisonbacteria bacterium RIFCSPLOWO2_01_FULL_40_28 TaxID=1798406 RepID=A0A1G1ZKF4_9BACT|nr:MAG: hypothetical protein A3A04_02660 [Candidatus Harrisonbacteria bacterium RIFCSPLOWO2_01_FULL_40_28]